MGQLDGILGRGDPLARGATAALALAAQQGDEAAMLALRARFAPLLRKHARRAGVSLPDAEVEDIRAQATCTFVELVHEFDPSLGVGFAHYVEDKLAWRMFNFARSEEGALPENVFHPGEDELPGLDPVEDLVPDPASGRMCEDVVTCLFWRQRLARLPARLLAIARWRAAGLTFDEIGAKMGVSEPRAYALVKKAARILKEDAEGESGAGDEKGAQRGVKKRPAK